MTDNTNVYLNPRAEGSVGNGFVYCALLVVSSGVRMTTKGLGCSPFRDHQPARITKYEGECWSLVRPPMELVQATLRSNPSRKEIPQWY
jgi:hypothetical protein